MKTITIYPTSVKVSEGLTLNNLACVEGFAGIIFDLARQTKKL